MREASELPYFDWMEIAASVVGLHLLRIRVQTLFWAGFAPLGPMKNLQDREKESSYSPLRHDALPWSLGSLKSNAHNPAPKRNALHSTSIMLGN